MRFLLSLCVMMAMGYAHVGRGLGANVQLRLGALERNKMQYATMAVKYTIIYALVV